MDRSGLKKRRGVKQLGNDDDSFLLSLPKHEQLRVYAYSTAESYEAADLLLCLQRRLVLLPYIADDVYHVLMADPASFHQQTMSSQSYETAIPMSPQAKILQIQNGDVLPSNSSMASVSKSPDAGPPEAFVFTNGCFVIWGGSDEHTEVLMDIVTEVANLPYDKVESEWFEYIVNPDQSSGMNGDTVIIGSDSPSHHAKLALSSGLVRSVKLASLENLLDAHLDKNRHVSEVLLNGKRLPMGRREVLRNLGELFSLRGRVNLHSELLDSPEICWTSSKMETLFNRISRNLNVKSRITVFNRKVDYANEIAELLRNHLQEEHAHRLEWIIEIIFEFIRLFRSGL